MYVGEANIGMQAVLVMFAAFCFLTVHEQGSGWERIPEAKSALWAPKHAFVTHPCRNAPLC
jgi:hypothetical protein